MQNECVYCKENSESVPLISFEFKGQSLNICSQHLPMLIHNPAMLIGKLQGAEDLDPSDHKD